MLARQGLGRALVFAALCLSTAPVAAQQPADKATINNRIEAGKKYLTQVQKPTGAWGDGDGVAAVGRTALAGITLIECGVPATDPGIKRAANLVRQYANDLDSTYELSLAILLLDRVKDPKDKRYIQLLAGRLIASQMPSGGWGYKAPKYTESNVTQLVNALKKLSAATPDKPVDAAKVRAGLPEGMRRLAVWTDGAGLLPADPPVAKDKRNDLYDATTDNSNTHFAMVGLWNARKYDIPVDRTFTLLNRRFRTSQGPGGTWVYDFVRTGADGSNAMTCIALLGVAIGHVVAPEPGVKPETDPVIINAFAALDKAIGAPVGDTVNRPTVKAVGGLYFLWSMERIAVLYDLQKVGNKDWYQWGAEILVCHQLGDGSWPDEKAYPGESPLVNTCLALLFLKRANLTPDLSKRLVVDPAALTTKVDNKLAPKIEPPPPVVEIAPPPHAVLAKPVPVRPVAATTSAPAPPQSPPEAEPPAPVKKAPWLWIVLGLFLLGLLGLLFFFLLARRRKDEDEDEDEEDEKKKKKAKKKAKLEEVTRPKSAGPKVVPSQTAKKAKAKVEVDEDD